VALILEDRREDALRGLPEEAKRGVLIIEQRHEAGDLLRHLRRHGCYLKREGASHSLYWCRRMNIVRAAKILTVHLLALLPALALPQASQEPSGAICGKVTKYQTGRVFLQAGEAVSGARIVAMRGTQKWEQSTDNAGKFCIRDLPPGPYEIVCTAPEALGPIPPVTGRVLVRPGATTKFNPALHFSPGVRGQVTNHEGKRVTGAFVTLVPVTLLEGKRSRAAGLSRTDEDGRYELLGIPPGRYRLELRIEPEILPDRRPVYYPALSDTSRAIELILMKDQHLQADFRLERPRKVTGTVTFHDGKPATNAQLFLTDADKFSHRAVVALAKSNNKGHFSLDARPGMILELQAAFLTTRGHFSASAAVTVHPEGDFRDVHLVLSPPQPPNNLIRNVQAPDRSSPDAADADKKGQKNGSLIITDKRYLRVEARLPAELKATHLVLFARGRSKGAAQISAIPYVAVTFLPVRSGEKRPQVRRGTAGRFSLWWQPVSAIVPIPAAREKMIVALVLKRPEVDMVASCTAELDDLGLYPFRTFTEAQIFLQCIYNASHEAGRLSAPWVSPGTGAIHFSPLPGVIEVGRPEW
jgi:hypothetical protein